MLSADFPDLATAHQSLGDDLWERSRAGLSLLLPHQPYEARDDRRGAKAPQYDFSSAPPHWFCQAGV